MIFVGQRNLYKGYFLPKSSNREISLLVGCRMTSSADQKREIGRPQKFSDEELLKLIIAECARVGNFGEISQFELRRITNSKASSLSMQITRMCKKVMVKKRRVRWGKNTFSMVSPITAVRNFKSGKERLENRLKHRVSPLLGYIMNHACAIFDFIEKLGGDKEEIIKAIRAFRKKGDTKVKNLNNINLPRAEMIKRHQIGHIAMTIIEYFREEEVKHVEQILNFLSGLHPLPKVGDEKFNLK